MYNKLFTKILDSSIWLEATSTRIVWVTLLAAMDEDGFCAFSSVENLAHRARVPIEDAELAVHCLESPDSRSGNPNREGQRIERVPGGWVVLNASIYRDIVTRVVAREQTRERVRQFRERQRSNARVTVGNASPESVTPSEASTSTSTSTKSEKDTYVPGTLAKAVPCPDPDQDPDPDPERATRFEAYRKLTPTSEDIAILDRMRSRGAVRPSAPASSFHSLGAIAKKV